MYCLASTGSSVARLAVSFGRQEKVERVERSLNARVREGIRCEKLSR
jgi:hypothetical protein